MDNSDIEKVLEMKNVSNETADKISAKYPPLSDEQKKRILAGLNIMDNNERQIRVVNESGKRPVLKIAACAAAFLIIAGVALKLYTESSEGSVPAANPEVTEVSETTEDSEETESEYRMENLPYMDIPPINLPENIEGLTEKEAVDAIRTLNRGKEYDLQTVEVPSNILDRGLAVKAEYQIGTEYNEDGSTYYAYNVILYISSGELDLSQAQELPNADLVSVPELPENSDESQAIIILENAGLNVQTKLVFDENIPERQVVKTDPAAGTTVKYGSEIVLYISRGNLAE